MSPVLVPPSVGDFAPPLVLPFPVPPVELVEPEDVEPAEAGCTAVGSAGAAGTAIGIFGRTIEPAVPSRLALSALALLSAPSTVERTAAGTTFSKLESCCEISCKVPAACASSAAVGLDPRMN